MADAPKEPSFLADVWDKVKDTRWSDDHNDIQHLAMGAVNRLDASIPHITPEGLLNTITAAAEKAVKNTWDGAAQAVGEAISPAATPPGKATNPKGIA